jgi:hypothetical protein
MKIEAVKIVERLFVAQQCHVKISQATKKKKKKKERKKEKEEKREKNTQCRDLPRLCKR